MPDLFDFEENQPEYGTEPRKLARRESPDTSKMAAESVETSRLEKMMHVAIAERKHRGCTASDLIDKFPSLPYSSITARFSALERKGLIKCGPDKRPGKSGRQQRIMRSIVDPVQ